MFADKSAKQDRPSAQVFRRRPPDITPNRGATRLRKTLVVHKVNTYIVTCTPSPTKPPGRSRFVTGPSSGVSRSTTYRLGLDIDPTDRITGIGSNDHCSSQRRVKEAAWANIVGLASTVDRDGLPGHGSTVGIRFRCGNPRSNSTRFNGEIEVCKPRRVEPSELVSNSPATNGTAAKIAAAPILAGPGIEQSNRRFQL